MTMLLNHSFELKAYYTATKDFGNAGSAFCSCLISATIIIFRAFFNSDAQNDKTRFIFKKSSERARLTCPKFLAAENFSLAKKPQRQRNGHLFPSLAYKANENWCPIILLVTYCFNGSA